MRLFGIWLLLAFVGEMMIAGMCGSDPGAGVWLFAWSCVYLPFSFIGAYAIDTAVMQAENRSRDAEDARADAEFQSKRESREFKRLIERSGLLDGGSTSIPIGYADIAIRPSWEHEPKDYRVLQYSGDRHLVTFGPDRKSVV